MHTPVLMYHSLGAAGAGRGSDYVVDAGDFRRQLALLASLGYESVEVEGLLAGKARRSPRGRCVVLTFDDGYLDSYTRAFPLLLEFGFGAEVFVVADFRRRRNWWDATGPTRAAALLEPDQMREMARHGIAFGSHGLTHRRLSQLKDAELRAEMTDSKKAIEDLIGEPVRHFAFPYGDLDERCKDSARRAGYSAAFAVHSGPLGLGEDRWEIRRTRVDCRSGAVFRLLKLSGVEDRVRCQHARWKGRWRRPPAFARAGLAPPAGPARSAGRIERGAR